MNLFLYHLNALLNTRFFSENESRIVTPIVKKNSKSNIFRKQHFSRLADIDRLYLMNELHVLERLQKVSPWSNGKQTVVVPQLAEQKITAHEVSFATNFFVGKKLSAATDKVILKSLAEILTFLRSINRQVSTDLGVRTNTSLLLSGLLYSSIACFKNPRLGLLCAQAVLLMVSRYLNFRSAKPQLGLSHRDLDPDNILINGQVLLLSDWENAVTQDVLFDLAQIPRLYASHVDLEKSAEFCYQRLSTPQERDRFVFLALFGCLQSLAIEGKNTHMYQDALVALTYLLPAPRSLYEYIFRLTFSTLGWFYQLFPFLYRTPKTGLILCYHAIGYDKWRFTTSPEELAEHLQVLKTDSALLSLSAVLKQGNGIAITFDDGYENVYTKAAPVLKQAGVVGTVFVLGSPEKANRDELDTMLPLLTDQQILGLHRQGWSIGHHTDTHASLATLPKSQLRREISQSKKTSEKRLGIKHDFFAYPKGKFDEHTINEVKKAGFIRAFTVDGGAVTSSANPLMIDRIPMEKDISAHMLKAIISVPGLKVNAFFLKVLQTKEAIRIGLANQETTHL